MANCFLEHLGFADFNRDMYIALEQCTLFDWSSISPAIFGSLFQGIMEPRERRQIGGHYTSERDIMKVIRSLFLDDLRAEFEKIKTNKNQLKQFHQKLAKLRFFDPACGCGNFLVIAYRELRLLEIEVLTALYGKEQQHFDIHTFAVRCGRLLWHRNKRVARPNRGSGDVADGPPDERQAFGDFWALFCAIAAKKSPTIVLGNALRLNWEEILPPEECSYVLGNPPFVGKHLMTDEQSADMELVWGENNGTGVLDYVTGWYHKAAEYIQGTNIVVGFVSTNSISQGEQVGVLWNPLFEHFGLKIHFAHRTFAWESEARGKAHVHVVIIGFASFDNTISVFMNLR